MKEDEEICLEICIKKKYEKAKRKSDSIKEKIARKIKKKKGFVLFCYILFLILMAYQPLWVI